MTLHGRNLGLARTAQARAAYKTALGLTKQEPERRFIERRLSELRGLRR